MTFAHWWSQFIAIAMTKNLALSSNDPEFYRHYYEEEKTPEQALSECGARSIWELGQ